jgi:hypothetical protein
MTLAKVLSISLCMGAGSLAFATDPAPPAATTAPDTADAASTAAADKAKTTATTAKTATSSVGVTPEQAKTLKSAGYKSDVSKGVTYYCRYETQIGTRFETKVCGKPDDILRSIATNQELVSHIQRSPIGH